MRAATILLVDDDEVLSQVLRRVLTREGYDVVEAGNIAQALEAARVHPPLLGLLDLSLPDGDGIELAKKLRAQGVTCPFILVTAYPLRLRDQPELGDAFTRVLTKPLNLEDLRQAIDAALAGAGTIAAAPAPLPDAASRPPEPSAPPPPPLAAAQPPRVRLRGLVLGGVIVAGLVFFVFVVVLPALGLPGVGDWFGKSSPPTASADQARGPAAALVDGQPDTLSIAPDVAKGLGIKTEEVSRPKDMETLTLSGSLNLDPDYLAHVHPRFQGEVIEIGPYIPPGSTPTISATSEPKRALRFGDRVTAGQTLAVLWSKDLGEKKNDLIEALAKLWTDQETLASLEELYKDLATSEANVRLQRSAVAADLSAVNRARNALRIWRLSKNEVDEVEAEAKAIYDQRVQVLKKGDKTSPSGGATTETIIKGKVKAAAKDKVTVTDDSGKDVDLPVAGDTKVAIDGKAGQKAEDIKAGSTILAARSGAKVVRIDIASPLGDWTRWARLEVKAPFDGTIVERNVAGGLGKPEAAGAAQGPSAGKDPAIPDIGELVDVGQDLFKIADMTHLIVWAYAYEQDLPALHSLQGGRQAPIPWTVKVTADPSDPNSHDRDVTSSEAYEVGPIIDPNQHTALVIGKAENPNRAFKAGQFVTASIPVPTPPHLVEVPASAIDESGSVNESIVFVQSDPKTLQYTMKRVQVVRRLQGRVYVRSEAPSNDKGDPQEKFDYLHDGDLVVTEGVLILKSTLEDLQDRQKAEK